MLIKIKPLILALKIFRNLKYSLSEILQDNLFRRFHKMSETNS